jgi:hypothetical protein
MLAQGQSAVLSFLLESEKSDSSFRNNQSKRCLSKERVLGDRTFLLRSVAIRQERFKTFPSIGSVNLSPFKAKAKTGLAT